MIEIWSLTEPVVPRVYLNDLIPHSMLVLALQLLAAFIAIVIARREYRGRAGRWELLALALVIQSFQYAYYCAYVDEVYVNLEHSWNLYHFGRFSFSPAKIMDGTVELFYYIVLAPFAWSHRSLVWACMALGLVVTLLHTVLFWYFVRKMPRLVQVLLVIGFAWNPIFAEIQSAGFGNGLVSLLYFAGLLAIWEERWKPATVFISMLPLIRPDAIAFSGLLILAMTIKRRKISIPPIIGTTVAVITFLIVVKMYYGHWVLTPVLFKKAPLSEVINGSRRQLNLLVYGLFDSYTLALFILLLCSSTGFMQQYTPEVSRENRIMLRIQALGLAGLYCFYILTNRYFFAETRRYYLPLEWIGFLLVSSEWGMTRLKQLFLNLNQTDLDMNSKNNEIRLPLTKIVAIIYLIVAAWSYESGLSRWKVRATRFFDRSSPGMEQLISREDPFSLIASIAEDVIPPDWRIATSELQGFGFMLDHDIDPLYGYANRSMAISNTLNRNGTKTDVNYLRNSRPEIIWTGRYLEIEFPLEFEPDAQPEILSGFQSTFGFSLDELITSYPNCFMIQARSDRGHKIFTSFLVRKGLEETFRDMLRQRSFQKKYDALIATDAFREWSKENPF